MQKWVKNTQQMQIRNLSAYGTLPDSLSRAMDDHMGTSQYPTSFFHVGQAQRLETRPQLYGTAFLNQISSIIDSSTT